MGCFTFNLQSMVHVQNITIGCFTFIRNAATQNMNLIPSSLEKAIQPVEDILVHVQD